MSGYTGYISALKHIVSAKNPTDMPRIMVIHGSSEFLRIRAMTAIKAAWSKLEGVENASQSMEGLSLDPLGFKTLWSQTSLFEPESLYFVRRCDKLSKLGAWMKEVKTPGAIKNRLILEFGDKVPAEVNRQAARLEAAILPCEEPSSVLEFSKIVATLAKREGLILQDDAVKLLLDSMGLDLGRLDNELRKLSLIYHGRTEPLTVADIASVAGHLREDHVFELFGLLRNKQRAKAQLLIDQLLERGEKSIALVGILSRFAREAIPRQTERGLRGLTLCADADIRLKSSRISEGLLLGRIVDALVD
jgi:DNA polymerase III delta subunit